MKIKLSPSTYLASLAVLAFLAVLTEANADSQPPTVNVLFPEAEGMVESSTPVIAFSVFDAESEVDPRATRVYLDGADVSLYVRNSGELVTFTPLTDLMDGVHRVAVVVGDTKGNIAPPKLWSFTVKATTPPLVQLAGNAVTEIWYADPVKFPQFESFLPYRTGFKGWTSQFTTSASGQFMGNILNMYGYVNSQSTGDQQTLQRFRGQMVGPGYSIGMGDLFPSYSEFSFYGSQRLRGLELGFTMNDDYPLKLKYLVFGGEGKQALEGGVTTSLATGTAGTFRQTVWGARAMLSVADGWGIHATHLRGKDEMGSIQLTGATKPTENEVTSIETTMNFPFISTKIAGEVSYSRYNSEVGTRPGEWGAGRAWKVKMMTDLGDHSWSLTYRDVRPQFVSFGNPYLQVDQYGVELSENSRLFNNQMFLSFGGNTYWDNAEQFKSDTTKTQAANMNSSFIFPGLPSMNLGGGFQTRKTGGEKPTTDNYTASINLGANLSIPVMPGWSASTYASYLFLQYRDFGEIRANHFNSLSATVGWVWTMGGDFTMSNTFGFNENTDLATGVVSQYLMSSNKFSYRMFNGVITPFVGYNGLASLNTLQTTNTRKDSIPTGVIFAFDATHNLAISFEHIEYKDLRTEANGYIENITIIKYTLNF